MKEFIERALADLEAEGRLTPDNVVDAARDPQHVLHEEFEWDDTKAGPLYRQSQARTLIRAVKLEMTVHSIKITVPAYVHDSELPNGTQGYVALTRIRSDDERKHHALRAELDRVRNAADRAREIAIALNLLDDVAMQLKAAVNGGAEDDVVERVAVAA